MKLKKLANIAISLSVLGLSFLAPTQLVAADNICDNMNISEEIRAASGCTSGITTPPKSLPAVIGEIISAIIGILGSIAVIFVLVGGFQYLTSSGDSAKLKKAKDTILYALIGLAICAVAFAITQFAIDAINSATATT